MNRADMGTVVRRLSRGQWAAIALLVLLCALIIQRALAATGNSADLDPESYQSDGSRAVMAVLNDHGVNASVVRSRDGLRPDANTTIVISSVELTPEPTLDRLLASSSDLVLIRPTVVDLSLLDITEVQPAQRIPRAVQTSGCPLLADLGDVTSGEQEYRLTPSPRRPTEVCFDGSDGTGSWVAIQDGKRQILIVGQPEILRNRSIALQANAAVALRTLGRTGSVQWYVPDPRELAQGEEPRVLDLLPRSVKLLPVALLLPIIAAMFWRGRRLGRLVTEPLPVVVRASETVEGRARLYRRAKATERAGRLLRTGAARRMAQQLNLSEGSPQDLVDRVADLTQRDHTEVHDLLIGPAPSTDAELLGLANALDALEHDLFHPSTPPVSTLPPSASTSTTQDGR